jgi:TonB-linked SusC/RagA family outer membrane protein
MKKILLTCLAALCLLISGELMAQGRTVSGRVTSSDDGAALPGVNVVLKGTTTGTVTDFDGRYSLNVPETGGTLLFTFIGLTTQEIEIGTRSIIDVAMVQDAQQLSEVVVSAFGIPRQKEELTYATEKIDANKLTQGQQTTAAQGLAGKIAGLQINVQNNGVNPSSQILLRGLRSVTSNNSALIVIDGVMSTQSAFDDLNPNDIESIDVLKGANAAALYGSNAGNGVLIVTTKNGNASNRFTVGLTSNYTIDEVAYMPEFQSKYGIGWAGHYDPIENTNWGPRFDGVVRQIGPTFADGSFQAVKYAPIKDNLKDFYQQGSTFQNTVYASGGNKDSKFYLSVGNRRSNGIVPDDFYKRTTVRANASHKIGKLELGVNSTFFQDNTDIVGSSIGDQNRPLYIPLSSYKDWKNPQSYGYADNYYNAYYQNPYWAVGTNRDTDNSTRLQGNFFFNYDITPNITWSNIVGLNHYTNIGKEWRDRQEYDATLQPSHATVTSFVIDSEAKQVNYNGSSILRGDFKLSDDFTLKPLLGWQFIQNYSRSSSQRGNNLTIPGFYDISNRTGELVASTSTSESRTVAVFGEISLGYRGMAHLNLTGRQDYVSTLKKGDNSYFYPSVGVNVVLSEAISAIRESRVINDMKISLSNATVYNDLSPYAINERYLQTTSQGSAFPYPLGNISGFYLSTTAVDAGIKKEKLNTTELSAYIGMFNNRLSIDASVYKTNISDLIVYTTPSNASGSTSFLTNIGKVVNQGVEVTVGGTPVVVGDFRWDLSVNYTSSESVVKEIRDDIEEIAIDAYSGYGTYAIKGERFPQIKASSYKRDPNGRVIVDAVSGNPIEGDVIALGQTTPKHIVGVNNTFSWKGLSLSATIDYRTGHVYYEQGSDNMEFTGRSIASVSADRQNFVWPNSVIDNGDGTFTPNTNIQITGGEMIFWQNAYNNIKENYVKDATALKLREVALNYTLPKHILGNSKVINKLTIGVVGRNLLTFLPEENRFADPEFNNYSEGNYSANSIGVGGYLQSPPTRSYGFNLNIEF